MDLTLAPTPQSLPRSRHPILKLTRGKDPFSGAILSLAKRVNLTFRECQRRQPVDYFSTFKIFR